MNAEPLLRGLQFRVRMSDGLPVMIALLAAWVLGGLLLALLVGGAVRIADERYRFTDAVRPIAEPPVECRAPLAA